MPSSLPKSRAELWISLALVALTCAVYWQTRSFDFVNYDDPDSVTANAHVRAGITPQGLAWAITSGDAANWFPVTRISHMLDCQFFGVSAGSHHLSSVFLHAFAALLLFGFLRSATRALWPSAFVACLFAIHPLHVESVAWISERKDVLCAVFWFLTLWLYVRYVERPSPRRYLLMLAAFGLGLMSKPMIVTLPFVLLLLDVWPLGRGMQWREKLPLFALSAASSAITLVAQKSSGAVESLTTVPFDQRLANAAVSYLIYISKTFWPSDLAVFYPYPASLSAVAVAGSALAILAVSAIAWHLRGRLPYLFAGWFWCLGTLVPVIGLVQVGSQAQADRYMYVPMVGLAIIVAWGAADMLRRWPSARLPIAGLAAAGCALCVPLSWNQTAYWRTSETLFTHALAVTSGNSLAEHNLGNYLLVTPERLPEAISHLEASLRITPDSASAHSDLGTALARSGRLPEALPEFQAALQLNPESAIVHNNLGNALRETGRIPAAIAEYRTALRIDPGYADARRNLDFTLRAPAPDSAESHYSHGVDYSHAGKLLEAVGEFQAALRLRPDYAEAENNLGVAMTQIPARAGEAMRHFETAVKLNPQYSDAHFNLGVALSQIPGRTAGAIAELEIAYRLNPDPDLRQTIDRLRASR